MVQAVKIKRSTTAGVAPASLLAGELAVNLNDKTLFVGDGTSVLNLTSAVSIASVADIPLARKDSSQGIILSAYYPGVFALANPGRNTGGGILKWAPNMPKSNHNGGTIFSPTVPWDGTQANLVGFLAGTGETASGTNGCFVRVFDRLHVTYFGAKDDDASGAGTDSYAAIQATINYAKLAKIGEVCAFGSFMITNTLIMDTGVYTQSLSLVGDGSTSNIRQTGASKDLLWFSTTQFMRNSYVKDINLVCTSAAGHGINIKFGCTVCRFENVNITVNNASSSCYKGDWGSVALGSPAGVFDTVWDGGDLYVPVGSTVHGIDFICNGTVFNENVFRNQRWSQSGTVQFCRIANNDNATYLVNNRFNGINFEVCQGGGILAYTAKNWTLENLSFWDTTIYNNHLVYFASSSGLESVSNTLINVTRNGDVLNTGIKDIFLEKAQDTVVINCMTPAANNPAYNWNNKRVTVLGAVLSGETNTANRVYANPTHSVSAWATFTGSTGASLGADNIASITRQAIGQYRLTFITAKANTNYRAHATISHGTLGWVDSTKTTGYVDIFCTNSAGAAFDPAVVDVTIFG